MLQFTSTKPPNSLFHSLNSPQFLPNSLCSISLPLHLPLFYTNSSHHPHPHPLSLRIRAIDAAQPYDYEAQLKSQHLKSQSLKIAFIGFGNFGQFLAKTLSRQGHTLLAYSRTNYTDIAKQLNTRFYNNPHDLCENHPDVLILCTSILSTEKVLKSFPFQRLKRNTLFVDVLSVKEFAKNVLLKYLPVEFDILCTHPMFGPESGKLSWAGLPFVFDKVRIGNNDDRISRCDKFLDIFAREGCRMVEMSCVEHDKYAAGSQFVTHTMGRVLEKFGLESSPINTKGYETLLDLVENTVGDSFELYYGLFMYNKNAMEQLERLDMAFEAIKKELFGKLHQVYRRQLFGTSEGLQDRPKIQKLLRNGAPSVEPPADVLEQERGIS
ncbi:arogenate dehydrogenase 2, chloroplastic-like [Ricinus communis]|uniref:arogenate dehydrogenase 2, chloroplastic-like n=1 Tax=Ricinus communis TaxID=3988 RepID=UPI00201A443E|nr:arogenate dehydrogenase 2, chloroplastic-like [Ricinus communis]XP_048233765.1 arogenate dehydrogenase 2, chloroplastic-like [Ricinus communis]